MSVPSSIATAERDSQRQLREMNEALLVSSLRQHELADLARQAEEILHQRTDQFETLLNESPIGIFLIDFDFRVRQVNPTALAVFGQIPNFIGRDFDEVIHILWQKAKADDIVRRFRHTLETGEPYLVPEFIEQRLDRGVTELYRWQISRIPLPEGRHGVVCYFWDISQSVITREALRESEVEYRRLFETSQEQAVALADLHRRKDEFLAMLSHELRNPLAPILNAVQLLGMQQNEDQLQQTARTIIERQVGQLTRLVDDLLEVSRITTGRIHLHQDRVNFNGIVEHAVETCDSLMRQRRHSVKVSLPQQPIWLFADAARLEQVVVNLLTNAAKYTDEQGQIWLGVTQEGEEAVLSVRDTGVGIAPELLPRIFDLFTQAERSLDRSQGGLGIGLSLVQRLVEMHQGRVEAHSSFGQGSEFVVRLPVMLSPASPPAAEKVRHAGALLRVLIVDDGRDVTHTFSMLLKAYGHEVRTAADGLVALETALAFRPHAALLDIGLPGMSGLEVAKRIRQQATLKNVVLIAMTGYGQETDRQRSFEAGFDHHLVKPADIRKVQEILATVKPHEAERS